jgi:hypothetical protein
MHRAIFSPQTQIKSHQYGDRGMGQPLLYLHIISSRVTYVIPAEATMLARKGLGLNKRDDTGLAIRKPV